MKNLDTFLGIVFIVLLIAGCQGIGKVMGDGIMTGLLFLGAAVGLITTLYWQVNRSKD